MSETFTAAKITEDVYWVGAIDWSVRNFHGYRTGSGTTYNAFLVLADKPTLIDTVKGPFLGEMLARIRSVLEPERIECIVSNHSEMDHSGCLPEAVREMKPAAVYASKMGARALASHFGNALDLTVVGDGDELDLGGRKLAFFETRMCHWPDSMVSYLADAKLLFSQDAFGMHLASFERFADELPRPLVDREAAKYYANILLPLGKPVTAALDKLRGADLPLEMVAPDHGPIWRRAEDIEGIVESYACWSRQEPTDKAVVVYDTMWQSTAAMARSVGDGLASGGVRVKMMPMDVCHRSDVATEVLEAGALVVGSPTMNNQIYPTIADVMTYLKGLRPANLVSAAFGSYGWGGEATKHLHAMLAEMGLESVAEPLRGNYVPDDETLARCRELGLQVAEATLRQASQAEEEASSSGGEPCTIDVNHAARTVEARTGRSLFDTLNDAGILLPNICGGAGLCGCCRAKVLRGAEKAEVTRGEKGHLSERQLADGWRLACQVPVTGDMAVEVPEESLESTHFRARVTRLAELTHDIRMLRLELIEPERIEFRPGQYIKLQVPAGVDPSGPSRPFSFANPPSDDRAVELIVRLNPRGVCTNWIFRRLREGDEVEFTGPFGDFGLSDTDLPMVWVAGGSGLSTFWSLLRHMAEQGIERSCQLYFGAVAAKDLYMLDELHEYERAHDWFSFTPALSGPEEADEWDGETGLITEVLDRHLADGSGMEAYLCGSPGMLAAARKVLQRKGVPAERVYFDAYVRTSAR